MRGPVGKQEFGAWRGLAKTNREFTPHVEKRRERLEPATHRGVK
jgi:hypothetical protein